MSIGRGEDENTNPDHASQPHEDQSRLTLGKGRKIPQAISPDTGTFEIDSFGASDCVACGSNH